MPRRLLLSFRAFLLENESRLDFIKKQKHNQAISFAHDTAMHSFLLSKMAPNQIYKTNQLHLHYKKMQNIDPANAPKPEELEQWKKEASGHIIDVISENDPHPKKIHTEWMVNQYKKENFRHEDLPRMREWLGHFQAYKPRLKAEGRSTDINSYKHPADMEAAVRPYVNLDMAASKGKEFEKIKKEGIEVVHNANGLRVEKLKTKEAACALYGHDTRWCTSARNNNQYDYYSGQGPLYVVHTPDKKKFQFHFESSQFADETDRMHQPEELVKKYPELKNVKAFKTDTKGLLSDHEKFTNRIAFFHDNEKEELFDKLLAKDKKLGLTLLSFNPSSANFTATREYIAKHGTTKHHKLLMNDNEPSVQREVALNSNDKSILHHLTQSRFSRPRDISAYRLETEFTGEKVPLVSPKLKKGSEMHLQALYNAYQYHKTTTDEFGRAQPHSFAYSGKSITYGQLGNWHEQKMEAVNQEFVKHFPHIANNRSANIGNYTNHNIIGYHRHFLDPKNK